jgi:hypothetical protein
MGTMTFQALTGSTRALGCMTLHYLSMLYLEMTIANVNNAERISGCP